MRAYVGVGIGHASIGSEQTRASLAERNLEIDDASGVAAAAGIDMDIGTKWFVNLDARWLNLNSTMQLDAGGNQRFIIDPYMFGLSIGRRLR
jgi:outer membrane protein